MNAANPFESCIWEGTRRLHSEDDVASLNCDASDRFEDQIKLVAADHRSRCTLLLGQPGLGKSHVLARLVEHDGRKFSYPVVVRRYALPSATFRNLFRQLIWGLSEQVLRGETTMLDDLLACNLRRVLPDLELETPAQRKARSRLRKLRSVQAIGACLTPALARACALAFEAHVRRRWGARALPIFSEDVISVGFQLLAAPTREAALRWLRGRDLDEQDLDALGLRSAIDDELSARDALASLALLAFGARPLAICFDQTERLESTPEERGIDALGRAIAFLRELPSLSLVFSCLKDKWARTYLQQLPSSYSDRIAGGQEDVVELAYPTPEEGVELVKRRLSGEVKPFDKANLKAWVDRFSPSARQLLLECAKEWRVWKRAGASGLIRLSETGKVAAARPAPVEDPRQRLRDEWAEVLRLTPPPSSMDADEAAAALSIVLDELGLTSGGRALKLLKKPRGSKLDHIVQAGRRRVALSFDDSNRGNSFSAQCKRLLAALEESAERARLDGLIVWRSAPIKRTWKKGRKLWQKVLDSGRVRFVNPSPESLRKLAAFRSLCSSLQGRGRDHRESAVRVFADELAPLPALQATLEGLEAESAQAAERTEAPAADGAQGVRDAIRSLLQELKLVASGRLRALLSEAHGAKAEAALVANALEDLEATGVIWQLRAAEGDDVIALC